MNGNKIFKGWPKTEIDKKKPKITVSPKYVDPAAVPLRNQLFWGGPIVFAILFLFNSGITKEETPTETIYLIIGVFILCSGVWIWQVDSWLRKTVNIEFTPDSIRIRKGWSFSGDDYNRSYPHGFNMEIHDEAEREFDDQQMETMERQRLRAPAKKKERIYRDSYHVYMDHVAGRIRIADVYQKKNAASLVTRLQGADQFMDIMLREAPQGSGRAYDPDRPGSF